jgi:ATP-dependent Clp protease ATP-binding subunit ClpA
MARVIQENLKRPLAEELLFGKLAHGGRVHVTVQDGKLDFELEAREKPVALEPV